MDSDPESDYSVDDLAEYDNKVWLLQNIFLFNYKNRMLKKMVTKARDKIASVQQQMITDPCSSEKVERCDRYFAPYLKPLDDCLEKLKTIRWISPEIEEEEYPACLKQMKQTELEMKGYMKECKQAVAKLVKTIHQFITLHNSGISSLSE